MVKQILVKDFDHAVSYIFSKLLAKSVGSKVWHSSDIIPWKYLPTFTYAWRNIMGGIPVSRLQGVHMIVLIGVAPTKSALIDLFCYVR